MEWENYYDRFFDWSESTRARRISELTSVGSADEITDIALEFDSDKNANKLIRKALSMCIHFSPENITTLLLTIDDTTIEQMIKSLKGEFTREWLEAVELYMHDFNAGKQIRTVDN